MRLDEWILEVEASEWGRAGVECNEFEDRAGGNETERSIQYQPDVPYVSKPTGALTGDRNIAETVKVLHCILHV